MVEVLKILFFVLLFLSWVWIAYILSVYEPYEPSGLYEDDYYNMCVGNYLVEPVVDYRTYSAVRDGYLNVSDSDYHVVTSCCLDVFGRVDCSNSIHLNSNLLT